MADDKHHANEQERSKLGRFRRGSSSDDELQQFLRLVALDVDPAEPATLTQGEFDTHAPRVLKQLGVTKSPKANTVYVRLNANARVKKPWRELVADSLADGDLRKARARNQELSVFEVDEPMIVYALRRTARANNGKTPTPDRYARLRERLIAEDHERGLGDVMTDVLPTLGQLTSLGPWAQLCKLARLEPPAKGAPARGHPLVKVLAHYYETQRQIPTGVAIDAYAREHGITLGRIERRQMTELKAQWIAERSSRGLQTPPDGPLPSQEMPPDEVAALLAGAPSKRPKGYWLKRERVLDCFVDFVAECEQQEKEPRLSIYTALRAEHGWPSNNAWQKHGQFQQLVEGATKLLRERRTLTKARRAA